MPDVANAEKILDFHIELILKNEIVDKMVGGVSRLTLCLRGFLRRCRCRCQEVLAA